MKKSRVKDTILSNRPFSIAAWIAPLIVLTACSAGNTLEPSDQASSAIVTIPSIDTDQSGSNAIDVPAFEAVTPEDIDSTEVSQPTIISLPLEDTVSCNAPIKDIQLQTVLLINEARSQPRSCGTESFEATDVVSWNTRLLQAADKHSGDMAQHNFFDHTGSDGSTVAMRVDETGYVWRAVGENIAAGQRSVEEVVAGWLDSPGHCRNLMNPVFTEVAVTCAEDSSADYTRYWTNVLAVPLSQLNQ